jgi:hypothetical protein
MLKHGDVSKLNFCVTCLPVNSLFGDTVAAGLQVSGCGGIAEA